MYEYTGKGKVVFVYTMKVYRGSTEVCPLDHNSGRK
jgi:hypothetical protein